MKTLFISPNAPDLSVGGIERHIKNLIDYSCQNNKEAIFLLPSFKQEGQEKIGNVTIIKKDFLNLSQKKFFNKKEVPVKELKAKSKEFFNFVKDLIKKENIQIVNAQNFHLSLPPVYNIMLHMACFLENVPMVIRLHSFIRSEMQKSLLNDLSWEKMLCVSKSVAGDCFVKGINIDRLHTQYLGVNRRDFRPFLDKSYLKKSLNLPENSKVILHASRIISGQRDILKEKGIITLLESFSQLVSKDPLYRLVIAAALPPKHLKSEFHYALDKIKGYTQLHNIEQKVFVKEFSLEDMPMAYNGADLFVLASENETFGQVYIEAMACGVPVIGTNVGGVPEIITDGYNGFLIAPGNPSNLTQKIEDIFNNENIRKSFIENGFKVIRRKFSSERQFSSMFNYLERISETSVF
jgi:glycosyltransferase involved in cell wall biosynthesis